MPKRNNFLGYFLLAIFLSLLVAVFSKFGILDLPYSLFSDLTTPMRRASASLLADNPNEKLKPLAQKLQQEQIDLEMKALRDQFAVIYPRSQNLLPAKVIGMPSFIPGVSTPEYLILDKGESDGVKIGQAVVLFGNLVGKIDKAALGTSRVILVLNKNMSFTGKLENGAIGVVKGVGDTIEIGNILLSEDVKKDALILTRGDQNLEELGIPPDLIVGKTLTVEKNPSDLFQKARIKSLVDFTKLNMVFVVVK